MYLTGERNGQNLHLKKKIKESWSENKLPITLFTRDYNSTKIQILHEMVSFLWVLLVIKVIEKSDNVRKRHCIKLEPLGTSILKVCLFFIFSSDTAL